MINIAEILKDCPKGTKLYSPICGECRVFKIYNHLGFDVINGTDDIFNFSYDGRYNLMGECCIFPSKENRDWSKFQRPFKDGDVLFIKATYNWILIYKDNENKENIYKYTAIPIHSNNNFITNDNNPLCCKRDISNIRFATEEEKQKLFDAIKENGYKWNEETKTLEKLVEPWTIQDAKNGDILAFNDETIIIFKDLYNKTSFHSHCHIEEGIFTISKEDMPDWWEGKGFYPATEEQRTFLFRKIKESGYKWNEETKTLEKLIKPKFKVDNKIKLKGGDEIGYITQVADCYYTIKCKNNTHYWPIEKQDDWELVVEPKFKVGDKIKHKSQRCDICTVKDIQNNQYIFEEIWSTLSFDEQHHYELVLDKVEPKFKVGDRIIHKDSGVYCNLGEYSEGIKAYRTNIGIALTRKDLEQWELAPNKFDITTLKPFDKVLVRRNQYGTWDIGFYGYYKNGCIYTVCGNIFEEFIPYEGNKHLLGTTNDCDEFYKTWK